MTVFLLYTLFFWIGAAGFAKVFYFSIQPDQWLDRLLGWQDKLEKFGQKSGVGNEIIYKALGGCEFCFGHFIAFTTFWFYALIMNCGLHQWIYTDGVFLQAVTNVVIYLIYVSTSTTINSLIINRL